MRLALSLSVLLLLGCEQSTRRTSTIRPAARDSGTAVDSGVFRPDATQFLDSGLPDPVRDAGPSTLPDASELDDAGPSSPEDTDALCSDGISNDGDRFIDCDDYDCSRNAAVTVCAATGAENTDALCSDGVSNDGDNYIDCDDFDCTRNPAVTVCGSDCATCTESATAGACIDEFTACASQTACQGLLICIEDCAGDAACSTSCRSQYPEGTALLDPLVTCLDTQCADVCS